MTDQHSSVQRGLHGHHLIVEASERCNLLLPLRVSGQAVRAREAEPHRAQALKHLSMLCIGGNVQCALALSGVRKEIVCFHAQPTREWSECSTWSKRSEQKLRSAPLCCYSSRSSWSRSAIDCVQLLELPQHCANLLGAVTIPLQLCDELELLGDVVRTASDVLLRRSRKRQTVTQPTCCPSSARYNVRVPRRCAPSPRR